MKATIIIYLLIYSNLVMGLPRPKAIPSRLLEVKTSSWYAYMYRSWNSYLSENPDDKSGWLEFFNAAQYAYLPVKELEKISDQIKSRFTGGFEAHYVQSKLEGWTDNGVTHLKRALELNSKSLLPEKILLSEFDLDQESRSAYAHELYKSNSLYPSLLNYSYNVLMSVGQNGVLFTQGQNTTIPLFILQDAVGVRTDVDIINLELAGNQDYLQRKLKSMGLDWENLDTSDRLGKEIPRINPQRSFYYALTLPKQDLEQIEDRLYVVGLTSQLSQEEVNNYAILKENIERNFLLDYLSVDFNGEPKTSTGKVLEANYTVPFLLLKQYYDKIGDLNMSVYWKERLLTIANSTKRKEQVEMLLGMEKVEAPNFKSTKLDIKALDKSMNKVKGNIFAAKYEVTNQEYDFFLTYLEENGYNELYKQAAFDLTKYDGIAFSMIKDYHFNPRKTVKTSASTYSKYPAMDMTFEAANLYCTWLTAQYNVQDNRKFKKVKFRLPSEKEWTMAALGYPDFQSWEFEENVVRSRPRPEEKKGLYEEFKLVKGDISYPWYFDDWHKMRNSIVNKHGCYLANIKAPDEVSCPAGVVGDGFAITSPVGFYFANKMGLYDAIGNVAEMISEEGKAMGGSWNHQPEESTITSINLYERADPAVGFRLFMEVIEE